MNSLIISSESFPYPIYYIIRIIIPGPEALLGKDAIDFAVSHPESYDVDYIIKITEIDPDHKDMYQYLNK